MPESRIGTEFGPYRLDALLGRGGMGEVYRAYDTSKDREVAIKLLNPGLADDEGYRERFRRECHSAARLGEPHIIPIHDWGEIDGVLYLDMRLVEGRDLRRVLAEEESLTPERAVAVIGQIADALDAAHADGLLHRDVKPENILLTPHDFAYLVDFGIAQEDSSTKLTQTGSTIGSFAYMAPEQFDGHPASAASDIYGLTAVLYECLTGRVPHPADTVSSAIKAAVLDPVPPLRSVRSDLPETLDSVIARGLAKDPAQRFASAGELAAAVRAAAGGQAASAREQTGSGETVSLRKVTDTGATAVLSAPAGSGEAPTTDSAYSPTMMRPSGPVPARDSTPLLQPGPTNPHVAHPQVVPAQSGYSPAGYAQAGYAPGGYPYPQPGYSQPPRKRSMLIPILAVVAVALLIVLGVVVYFAVATKNSNTSTASQDATVTATVTSTTDAPTAPTTAAPPATPCDPTVGVGSDVTSCPFAFAVRDEYLRTGPKGPSRAITAYSPVTGTAYVMACDPQGSAVVCRGGNNAVVVIY